MAALKAKQIREMKPEDVDKRLSELKLELVKELGNVKMGRPVKNPGRIKELKKAIARLLTVGQEKKKEKRTKRE
jgi:large subunit ribosomal protein L29